MKRLLLAIVLTALAGCAATVSSNTRPDLYYERAIQSEEQPSLFSSDAEILTDAAIARILDYRYEPPQLSRIALMPFGREVWSTWSEELSQASEDLRREVIDRLVASPRVYDASYLPSILIPDKQSVPYLREAGARYQADLLIVYRSYCRSFEKYRVFAADRSRAFCGVEAVLLDIRTGLVPFTSVAASSFDTKENDADLNFRETILKAQLAAVTEALADVSREIVAFLGNEQASD